MSVSYTHLDVYKRQRPEGAERLEQTRTLRNSDAKNKLQRSATASSHKRFTFIATV